jgi:outer membrane cobalamin receptor
LILFLVTASLAFSQSGIRGVVYDAIDGETLIGANIVYGEGKGTATDFDGRFEVELPPGSYTLEISYVGYEMITRKVNVKAGQWAELKIELKSTILGEVEVVADLAIDRETPVAFSNITPRQVQRELASQDLPMVLNTTPGIYATQQGGGDGDARINIRGFSQRNVAVMIDGIPVNDMENGWVYWSNWFGLDMITQRMQVQRGLGVSKLAIPSVGGTINIMTRGLDSKRQTRIKQEVGNNGFLRTSVGYNSGRLPGDWGLTLAGSFKRGDGWVDNTWTEGYFFYFKVDKQLGKHLVSLSGFGAPQQHGQRSWKVTIAEHDKEYARGLFTGDQPLYDLMSSYNQGLINEEELQQELSDMGLTQADFDQHWVSFADTAGVTDRGVRYNQHWGDMTPFDTTATDTIWGQRERITERRNYYHKPLFALKDFWTINDKWYMSNILYLSVGNGGGTALNSSNPPRLESNGQIDFQKIYVNNKYGPWSIDPTYHPSERKSSDYLQASVNNHFWTGLLSTVSFNPSQTWSHSGGLDLRYYVGEHYRIVDNLLGGDYMVDMNDNNSNQAVKREGDKISYHNDAVVRWAGGFYQAEYTEGLWATFINFSGAVSQYQRVDYFRNRDLVLGDTIWNEAVGYGDTVEYKGDLYTHTSPEARPATTDWETLPSFTIKAGAKYNVDESNSVFLNAGYISRAPLFRNVFYFDNSKFKDIQNEYVKAVELGHLYRSGKFSTNLNAYYTRWENKPVSSGKVLEVDDELIRANINGMDAVHMGIEFDFAYEFLSEWKLQGLFSLGDWTWASGDTVRFTDNDNNPLPEYDFYFNANGVHVGDAAQTQFGFSLEWEPVRRMYFRLRGTHFARHYSDFDPFSLIGDNEGRESWKTPQYTLFDFHTGYTMDLENVQLTFRGSVLNLINSKFISDAENNDPYANTNTELNSIQQFNANSASVFFGMGRRFNISLTIGF